MSALLIINQLIDMFDDEKHISSNQPSNNTNVASKNTNMEIQTIETNRHNKWKGTTYYAHFGDKLGDYQNIQVPASQFIYHSNQHTLVCGECDFSFTASLIRKRGGSGIHLCSTSYYYERYQWFRDMPNIIRGGVAEFDSFLSNLKYCKYFKSKVTFGIDARSLRCTESRWNDRYRHKNAAFDRIIFTFPRRYNKNNENLLLYILKSMKSYLNENGEIHLMLFKEQFWNWHINKIVSELDLKLFYWTQLNKSLLNMYFNGYIPRDAWGNVMQLEDYNRGSQFEICFCSFVKNEYSYKYFDYYLQPIMNIYASSTYNNYSTAAPVPIHQHIHIHHHYYDRLNSQRKQIQTAYDGKGGNVKEVYFKCTRCGLYNGLSSETCAGCNKLFQFTIPCKKCGLLNRGTLKSCSACYEPLVRLKAKYTLVTKKK